MTLSQHYRAILILGLPLIGSQLAQFLIGLVDTIMLGWYGVEALAASVLAHSFFFILFLMGAGFAFAILPIAASAAAQDDQVRVRRVSRMGLWLSVLYALAVAPLMVISEYVLITLGQKPELAALAQDYLRIAAIGMVPSLLVMVLRSFLSSLERTQIILAIMLVSVVLNAGLNWMLIFGRFGAPELGIEGAALASVLTQSGALILTALYIAWLPALLPYALFHRLWRPDWEAFGEVFRLGWPIGLTNLSEVTMFAVSAVFIGLIGTIPLAGHGIALQIASGTFMIHLGLSQAATIRAGRAVGRGDIVGLKRGGWAVLGLSMATVAATIIVFLTIPELLVGGFIGPDDPARTQIIAVGVTLLAVAALFQLVDAGQVIALGLLRGLQDTKVPMIQTAFSYWGVGVPLSYLIGITWGGGAAGVWLGLVVGLSVACVLLWARFIRQARGLG
ncbi:MAG: MATE family efflux transporter [Pseudomonadota bacterium]